MIHSPAINVHLSRFVVSCYGWRDVFSKLGRAGLCERDVSVDEMRSQHAAELPAPIAFLTATGSLVRCAMEILE